MDYFISFIISVMAGIVSYFICKWLDGNKYDNTTYIISIHHDAGTPRGCHPLGVPFPFGLFYFCVIRLYHMYLQTTIDILHVVYSLKISFSHK